MIFPKQFSNQAHCNPPARGCKELSPNAKNEMNKIKTAYNNVYSA